MQILPYDPRIETIWSTPNPMEVVTRACSTTQKGIYSKGGTPTPALIQFLYDADHGNPLEHAVICLDITQISRACADQLRTHRTCSPTMSSTHYQEHSDHPHRVALGTESIHNTHNDALQTLMSEYQWMIHNGIPKEDARQYLPLSIEVRYMLTINARSLAHMLRLRMCYRNTVETVLCAERMHSAAMLWFPELFNYVMKPCAEDRCREGRMACDYTAVQERVMQYD
jgi:thymidylate synthase, flavin-dependent